MLYFRDSLHYDDKESIAYYSFMISFAYFMPLVGSLVADGGFGRYRTILYCGLIYIVGLVVLAHASGLSSEEDSLDRKRNVTLLGLFFVCVGTGGIKPCVSAFGADQVAYMERLGAGEKSSDHGPSSTSLQSSRDPLSAEEKNGHTTVESDGSDDRVRKFFSYFYFCINVGALTSIAIVPLVKSHYGFHSAFIVPTCVMTAAMALFVSQRASYTHQTPGQNGTSITTTFRLVWWLTRHHLASIIPILRPSGPALGHVPVPVEDVISRETVFRNQLKDAAQALHVLPIMAMFPIFWCLYDQQGSVWTLQASRMDLSLFGWNIQPEQMTLINPMEIMVFIPLFDRVVYPALQSWRINIHPLRRMVWGMVLSAVSFVLSGFVEAAIRHREQNNITPQVNVFWQLPQLTILAIGEIFVSVTGLEFAYATSPEHLKAFLVGIFLLTTAIGDSINGVLYSTVFKHMAGDATMYSCAALLTINIAGFLVVARWYHGTNAQTLQQVTRSIELS